MKTSANTVYNFKANAEIPRFAFLSFLLTAFMVLLILAEVFGTAVEFVVLLEGLLSYEAMIGLVIVSMFAFTIPIINILWKDHKKEIALQHVYGLQLQSNDQRIRLIKKKKKGFVNFNRSYALLTHEGPFMQLCFQSYKSNKVIGTLTNDDDRWKKEDILQVADLLQKEGMEVKKVVQVPGIQTKKGQVFKSSKLNENIITLAILVLTIFLVIFKQPYLLQYMGWISAGLFAVAVRLLFNQKQFIVSKNHLLVKNCWIPGYGYQIPFNKIRAIQFHGGQGEYESRFLEIVIKGKKGNKFKKFQSKVDDRELHLLVFLVNEQTNQLAS